MYSIIKTTFTTGETSYNFNKVVNLESQTEDFLKSAVSRISIDVKNGTVLNRTRQFFLDGEIKSCEVLQVAEDRDAAKRLVNLNCDIDPYNIRKTRFRIN
jgi:hypothetical protein